MDDSQEEDCTVFIQEMKSDNASLKLNAASKLANIAAVLGHNRIRDELIPYLIQIIQQMDNENDFLVKVTEGLVELKQFCKTPTEVAILINPLQILASLDQPAVRDQAIVSFKKLCAGEGKEFFEKYYMQLIRQLNQKPGPYSPRVTACSLIPITYPNVNVTSQAYLRKAFRELALEQNSPLVRRALAENMQALANVVDKNTIKTLLLQIWQRLLADPIDIIRIKGLECAVVVARAFKKEEVNDIFFQPIKKVDQGKKAWRIRYSLVECLALLINYLEKEVIRKEVADCFEELLKDAETEVRAIALIKLPELTQKLSNNQSYQTFFQYLERAAKEPTKDAPLTIKMALLQAIVPYFRTIEKDKIAEGGTALIASLLKDENQVIRIVVMQKLPQLLQVAGKDIVVRYLLPLLESCLTDKKWRFKLAYSESIVALIRVLGYDQHKAFFEKTFTAFLKDHNSAVREQTIKCFVEIKQLTGEGYRDLLLKYLTLLLNDGNYIYRVTACMQLAAVGTAVDKGSLNEFFLMVVKRMEEEKVPNVLIAFFVTYAKIKGQLTTASKKEFQLIVRKVEEDKSDEDVQYFASIANQ